MATSIPYNALPMDDGDDEREAARPARARGAAAGTGGSGDAVQWEVVARTPGLLPAQIITGRLRADGIPARAWQESLGQVYGMTVGPMGTGYVSVPEEFAEEALALLDEAEAAGEPDEDDEEP